jgi:hypothetical protein
LASQLSDAVAALREAGRSAGNGGPSAAKIGRILPKLEAAVGALRDAAASSETEASLESAKARIEALPEEDPEAVKEAEAEVAGPALRAIEKGLGRLQEVLSELDSAVGAAKDAELPSAPPLKD